MGKQVAAGLQFKKVKSKDKAFGLIAQPVRAHA